MFWRLLSCFLAEFFPFRSSRVLMSLLLKAVGLRELWRKFPHSSPLVFPRLWYLGLYGLKIPILLDTRATITLWVTVVFLKLGDMWLLPLPSLSEHWLFSSSVGHCPEPVLENGTTNYSGPVSAGDKIMFKCIDGYILKGSNRSQCQEDHTWAPSLPICRSSKYWLVLSLWGDYCLVPPC